MQTRPTLAQFTYGLLDLYLDFRKPVRNSYINFFKWSAEYALSIFTQNEPTDDQLDAIVTNIKSAAVMAITIKKKIVFIRKLRETADEAQVLKSAKGESLLHKLLHVIANEAVASMNSDEEFIEFISQLRTDYKKKKKEINICIENNHGDDINGLLAEKNDMILKFAQMGQNLYPNKTNKYINKAMELKLFKYLTERSTVTQMTQYGLAKTGSQESPLQLQREYGRGLYQIIFSPYTNIDWDRFLENCCKIDIDVDLPIQPVNLGDSKNLSKNNQNINLKKDENNDNNQGKEDVKHEEKIQKSNGVKTEKPEDNPNEPAHENGTKKSESEESLGEDKQDLSQQNTEKPEKEEVKEEIKPEQKLTVVNSTNGVKNPPVSKKTQKKYGLFSESGLGNNQKAANGSSNNNSQTPRKGPK